ncbi:ABC transporter permease [Pelagibius sp. Alg239-R121]|uniref:ABC transporter permease n=1 Tax=Pelagibius sp. Alg239-R121 TaxID=2993448 RepID=UPI0024A6288D|nr:ABC transporter permease [Pelagibius sp. Alg239-R121]
MTLFLVKRLIMLAATLLVAAVVVFFVLEILPGDPALVMLGVSAQADTLAALRAEMGLDLPAWQRFTNWIGGVVTGELGRSYTYDVPVSELIGERVVVSLPLAVMALTLSTVIAIPLGVIAASRHNRTTDIALTGAAQIGIAISNFWFAILLILLFSVTLRWVPAGGFAGWDAGFWPAIQSLLLPAIALALPQAAILTRVTRSSVLEVLQEDFVRTARAKGLSRRAALWRHAVRNALIPVITILGLQFSFLLAGTIIIENVFYLPGLGRLLFQAIAQRDLIVVKDLVVLLAGTVVVVNFVVDLGYAVLDPRLRSGGGHV